MPFKLGEKKISDLKQSLHIIIFNNLKQIITRHYHKAAFLEADIRLFYE